MKTAETRMLSAFAATKGALSLRASDQATRVSLSASARVGAGPLRAEDNIRISEIGSATTRN